MISLALDFAGMIAPPRRLATANTLLSLAAVLLTFSTPAADLTGLNAVREANQKVAAEARDKIIQLRSDKSTNSLSPDAWTVLYYDPSVRMKTTVVNVGHGKEAKVEHPFRLFNRPSPALVFDASKVRIDSDEALKVARQDRLLEKVKLTSSRVTLELWEDGPVWKIEFWAGKSRDTQQAADIGQIFVDAREAKVVNRDLHISRSE